MGSGALAIDPVTPVGGSAAGAGRIGVVGRSIAGGEVGAFGADWGTGAAMRTGEISTSGETDAADVVGTSGASEATGGVLAGDDAAAEMGSESGTDAGACGETSGAACAASGPAARATGSMTAGTASGRRPTGRWPAGLLAMGRLSMMGTEVDGAVGSTPSEVDDRVPCARESAAELTRAGRREETGFFDGDGDRLAGNIGVADGSERVTSGATAAAGGRTAGAAIPDGTLRSGTALDGTGAVDPAALH